ncbi:MAG: type IV pilin protein [Burkholderiales bacterium]|nr:type IV pilin protein [Burkholderiales bacterium]
MRPASLPSKRVRGFTLIELMITVAVVGILAAIALPSYLKSVARSNRSAAESYMLEVSSMQQRYMLDGHVFAPDMGTLGATAPNNVASSYTISTAAVAGPPPGFTVTATPIGSQVNNDSDCGILVIDQTGATFYQTSLNDAAGLASCWKR